MLILTLIGCGPETQSTGSGASGMPGSQETSNTPTAPGSPSAPGSSTDYDDDDDAWRIRVITPEGDELWSFTESQLSRLPQNQAGAQALAYSTINNWPTARFYAAEGYSIESILDASGVLETAQTISFRAEDGYEASFTRAQLLEPQYFFPNVRENDAGASAVMPMIAYRWRDGTSDISEVRDEKPTLIIGQRNPFEHTNPAFVIGVTEIIVDASPSETWPAATTFPLHGLIAEGETVKLQHPDFGRVKLHYTLDGSEPTPLSAMYNPSTFQPELNRPIPITEPTTIKVLVVGFGRNNSEIATFEFEPVP